MWQITGEDMRDHPVNKVKGSVTRYVHLVYVTQMFELRACYQKTKSAIISRLI